MQEELGSDVPRLCHLRKWPDFDGYGFNLYGDKGKEGQNIGSIHAKSPAKWGGLREGDKVIEVNGINVLLEDHKSVIEKIKSMPNEVTLLVVSSSGWDYYCSKNVHLTGDLEFTQHFESPPVNPHSSYYSRTKRNHLSSSSSSSSVLKESPLRRCRLHRWDGTTGYGFNLQTLENKQGKFVGQVDTNSPSDLGGLREGDRIIRVNQVNITNLAHKEVVELIKSDPSGVTLLVVDQETDEYHRHKGELLGVSELKEDMHIVECSNPLSNPFDPSNAESFEMKPISKSNNETKFDDDDDEENNNTNNNNNNFISDKIYNGSNNYNNFVDVDLTETNNNNKPSQSSISTSLSSSSSPPASSSSSPPPASSSSSSAAPLSFSSSAAEARMRMQRKTKATESNLSLQDKFEILQRL